MIELNIQYWLHTYIQNKFIVMVILLILLHIQYKYFDRWFDCIDFIFCRIRRRFLNESVIIDALLSYIFDCLKRIGQNEKCCYFPLVHYYTIKWTNLPLWSPIVNIFQFRTHKEWSLLSVNYVFERWHTSIRAPESWFPI